MHSRKHTDCMARNPNIPQTVIINAIVCHLIVARHHGTAGCCSRGHHSHAFSWWLVVCWWLIVASSCSLLLKKAKPLRDTRSADFSKGRCTISEYCRIFPTKCFLTQCIGCLKTVEELSSKRQDYIMTMCAKTRNKVYHSLCLHSTTTTITTTLFHTYTNKI